MVFPEKKNSKHSQQVKRMQEYKFYKKQKKKEKIVPDECDQASVPAQPP